MQFVWRSGAKTWRPGIIIIWSSGPPISVAGWSHFHIFLVLRPNGPIWATRDPDIHRGAVLRYPGQRVRGRRYRLFGPRYGGMKNLAVLRYRGSGIPQGSHEPLAQGRQGTGNGKNFAQMPRPWLTHATAHARHGSRTPRATHATAHARHRSTHATAHARHGSRTPRLTHATGHARLG